MRTPPLRRGDLLAAYGLLRPKADGLDTLHARARVEHLGPCRIPGRLFDLGACPGLVAGEGDVVGDLLRLKDGEIGAAFDAFEDFERAAPAASAYVRAVRRLRDPDVDAWVYIWNGATTPFGEVPGGDWLAKRR